MANLLPEGLSIPLLREEVDDGVHDDADPVKDVKSHVEARLVEVLVNLKGPCQQSCRLKGCIW